MKLLIFILFVSLVSGCSNFAETANAIRDQDMTVGCYVTEAGLAFDSYFKTTAGKIDTCKLKCSKSLPKDFKYKYENTRTGCSVQVGK